MAKSWGLPDFRFIEMPHPIANLTDAQLDERAAAVTPKVVELLMKGQEA